MLTIVEFDFDRKVERKVTLTHAKQSMAEGKFVWIDLDTTDAVTAGSILDELGVFPEAVRRDVLRSEPDTRLTRFPGCVQLVLTTCKCDGDRLVPARIEAVLGKTFFLTAHDGETRFLSELRKDYGDDFVNFASSPGFLMFELWDHLIDEYIETRNRFEARVAQVQAELMGEITDRVFEHVARLGTEILRFRNVLVPARSVLAELSSRKTMFLSEATQVYLENMVQTLQRVLADLVVDRDVLADALNLHLSMTSHRTNRVMGRLTSLSMIFLPLTFLCGIYGMNFQNLPEVHWRYGYVFFWVLACAVVGLAAWFLRRHRLM